jgi:hypothetical protein
VDDVLQPEHLNEDNPAILLLRQAAGAVQHFLSPLWFVDLHHDHPLVVHFLLHFSQPDCMLRCA